MPLSGFIDPNSEEAKAKEIKISSTNGNGENVAIVLDDDNSKQDRPNYDKQYYALHRKLILEKKKNTINNRMLNNIMPNTKTYYETYKEELNRKSRDYHREKSSKGNWQNIVSQVW
jgi:hypothetical protein